MSIVLIKIFLDLLDEFWDAACDIADDYGVSITELHEIKQNLRNKISG